MAVLGCVFGGCHRFDRTAQSSLTENLQLGGTLGITATPCQLSSRNFQDQSGQPIGPWTLSRPKSYSESELTHLSVFSRRAEITRRRGSGIKGIREELGCFHSVSVMEADLWSMCRVPQEWLGDSFGVARILSQQGLSMSQNHLLGLPLG